MENRNEQSKLLKLNIQHFSNGEGENAGQETPPTNDDGGAQGVVETSNTTQTSNTKQDEKNQQEQTENLFTQKDVNNIVTRETRKTQEEILKQLGIDNIDNAKEGMKKFQEWQESQKTEQQKQQEQLQNLEKQFQTTQAEKQKLVAQVSAMKAGVQANSVEDVVVLANALVTDDVTIDDAIAQVIKKYPHFAVAKEADEDREKPKFSTGQHKKTEETEAEKWLNAFKI